MALTLRQQIFEAITVRLQSILRTNGYNNDLGQHVFPWKLTSIEDPEQLPAVKFRDTGTSRTGSAGMSTIHRTSYEIEVVQKSDVTADEIRDMLRDVVNAIGSDPTFGGLAADTEISEDTFMIDIAKFVIASGQVSMIVTYREGEYNE